MQNFSISLCGVRGVLGGDDDVGDGDRPAVFVDDRDLRLGVGTEPATLAGLANPGQLPSEPVGEHDRGRHQLRRLVAGVAEHQALVAGALLRTNLALRLAGIDTLRDVRRLLRHEDVDEHLVGVKHVVVVDVADLADRVARDLHEVELGLGRDLAADDHDVRLDVGFTGDAAELVLRQARIEDGVGNRVGDFVGMAFTDGLGGKNVTVAHSPIQKKCPLGRGRVLRLRQSARWQAGCPVPSALCLLPSDVRPIKSEKSPHKRPYSIALWAKVSNRTNADAGDTEITVNRSHPRLRASVSFVITSCVC